MAIGFEHTPRLVRSSVDSTANDEDIEEFMHPKMYQMNVSCAKNELYSTGLRSGFPDVRVENLPRSDSPKIGDVGSEKLERGGGERKVAGNHT